MKLQPKWNFLADFKKFSFRICHCTLFSLYDSLLVQTQINTPKASPIYCFKIGEECFMDKELCQFSNTNRILNFGQTILLLGLFDHNTFLCITSDILQKPVSPEYVIFLATPSFNLSSFFCTLLWKLYFNLSHWSLWHFQS